MKYKFGVAVPARNGLGELRLMLIGQMYATKEELDNAYKIWDGSANSGNLTRPRKIEIVDETGKCRVIG